MGCPFSSLSKKIENLKKVSQYKNIEFYTEDHLIGIETPKPAYKSFPEWWNKNENRIHPLKDKWITDNYGNGFTNQTVKSCIPFTDAMSLGYIIPFPFDVNVRYLNKTELNSAGLLFSWTFEDYEFIMHQSAGGQQIKNYPLIPNDPNDLPGGKIFKFRNPWTIKTPPGYSCLFLHPLNHCINNFEIFSGVVDTDKYFSNIHFPFIWKDLEEKSQIIKAGTPMVQIIPFKREDWKMENKFYDKITSKLQHQVFNKLKTKLYNGYKDFFWSRKKYI